MCWRTYYGVLSVQRTATKDIRVKKAFIVMGNTIKSLYFNSFIWTQCVLRKTYLGTIRRFKLACIDDHIPQHYVWSIEEGFHSAKYIKIVGYHRNHSLLRVDNGKRGFHVTYIRNDKTNIEILNCIIPKGSKYYVNECGEYVSDQLIVLSNQ